MALTLVLNSLTPSASAYRNAGRKLAGVLYPCLLGGACTVLLGCGDPDGSYWDNPIEDSLFCSVPPPATPEPQGMRVPEEIQSTVRQHYGELRLCYEALLARIPEAEGRVETRFVISSDGAVVQACISEATLNDDLAVRCMLQEFRDIDFGPADGNVAVVYPILYSPT